MFGRAALDDIGYVDFFTCKAQSLDHLVEKFSCSANERSSLLVLIEAGTFSNEHQPGLRRTFAIYDRRPAQMQRATGALADVFPDVNQSFFGLDLIKEVSIFDGPRGFVLASVSSAST